MLKKILLSFFISFASTSLTAEILPHEEETQVLVLGKVEDKEYTELLDSDHLLFPTFPTLDFEMTDLRSSASFQSTLSKWTAFFAKTLLEQRLSYRTHDHITCHFFPLEATSPIQGCALIGSEDVMTTIETSIRELYEMTVRGITEWELLHAKDTFYESLYDTSELLAKKGDIIMQSITTEDIRAYLKPLYCIMSDDLNVLNTPEDESELFEVSLCSFSNSSSFYSLTLSSTDKENIYYIIHTLAGSGVFSLLKRQKEIRRTGDKIEHVHPLRFLSYVMGEGGLRDDMKKIRDSRYKWSNFISSFTSRLKREHAQNNLLPYVPEFAESLGLDKEVIYNIIQRKDWKGLVTYFL